MADQMVRYECIVCSHIDDPRNGDPAGPEFEALPDDRVRPECMIGTDRLFRSRSNSAPGRAAARGGGAPGTWWRRHHRHVRSTQAS